MQDVTLDQGFLYEDKNVVYSNLSLSFEQTELFYNYSVIILFVNPRTFKQLSAAWNSTRLFMAKTYLAFIVDGLTNKMIVLYVHRNQFSMRSVAPQWLALNFFEVCNLDTNCCDKILLLIGGKY